MTTSTEVPSIPTGDNFEIKSAEGAGRGVFALNDLASGTPILATDLIPAYVINKEYKKEVCFQCLKYERGRTLKARDVKSGHYFCGSACQIEWRSTAPKIAIEAWEAMTTFHRTKDKQGNKLDRQSTTSGHAQPTAILRPSEEDVEEAWAAVESTAHFIREARKGSNAKPHRRSVQAALAQTLCPDQMTLLMSGCLTKLTNEAAWAAMLELAPDETPYTSKADLDAHITSYLQMLAFAPIDLLPAITAQDCLEIPTRDSHNSFGIRSLDDNGDEFFGFAIWPYASYFNHSCDPTLDKGRTERTWSFWLNRPVSKGDELFISYLGGDEREMDVIERRRRLKSTWQFECACHRCKTEAGEMSKAS